MPSQCNLLSGKQGDGVFRISSDHAVSGAALAASGKAAAPVSFLGILMRQSSDECVLFQDSIERGRKGGERRERVGERVGEKKGGSYNSDD